MTATVAERVAALEAERATPTPRRRRPNLNVPFTPEQQARHRDDLLAALRSTA